MSNFCTLFDSGYLSRGIAMYYSLEKHCEDFHIYIFAFDNETLNYLRSLSLKFATIISLSEFEDEQLLAAKLTRTRGEYCWTCTPSTILYVLEHYKVENCTYLDSDLYFFASPQLLLEEMADDSILITPHRYTAKYDQSKKAGIYCVQFVTFKKDSRGIAALNCWRNVCLDWCYNRVEDGKFGDQKYLDDWPERFEGVHVLQHLGGGVAPWNMQQYEFEQASNGSIIGTELKSKKKFTVIFFHFHSLTYVTPSYFSPRPYYKRNISAIQFLFNPYVKEIKRIRHVHSYICNSERYLKGWKLIKYLLEVFVRRGITELYYIKLLHNNG